MGVSVAPEPAYSPDNPFAGKQYSPDNPFAGAHHNKPKIGQMGRAITTEEDAPAGPPGVGTKILGVLAALNRDIPGAEAAQAGIRSVVRGQPYAEARNDIRGAEDAAPWQATLPARLAGAGIAAATVPGGPILQGARFGALSGLGQSDPNLSLKDRIRSSGEGAAVGGLVGAIGPTAEATGATIKGTYKTAKDIAGLLHGNPAAAIRLGRRAAPGIRAFVREATSAAPAEVAPAVEAAAPQNIVEAVKAAKQSHRTIAQFQNFAERMGADVPKPQTMEGKIHLLLTKLRAEQPGEVAPTWGDAEEAMGAAPDQQPDLESLLRQSLRMKRRLPGASQ